MSFDYKFLLFGQECPCPVGCVLVSLPCSFTNPIYFCFAIHSHKTHKIFSLWFLMILLPKTNFVVFNTPGTYFILIYSPTQSNACSCFRVVFAFQTSVLLAWCHHKFSNFSLHFIGDEMLWYILSYMISYITLSSKSVSILLMTLVIKYFLWDLRLDSERRLYRLQNKQPQINAMGIKFKFYIL